MSKAALTAALTLGAARHGSTDVEHTRKSSTGALETSNMHAGPDLSLIYRAKPTTLILSPTTRARRSHNTEFDEHINAAAAKHGVSVDLVRAIIQVESGFDRRATSRRGARGLMQLMPGTARDMGARNAFDPRQNIFAGVRYLRFLLDAFQGNVTLATAAYNAGPTVVKRYGGVPPFEETQDYVEKVESLIGLAPPPTFMDALFALPSDVAAVAPGILRTWSPPRRGR